MATHTKAAWLTECQITNEKNYNKSFAVVLLFLFSSRQTKWRRFSCDVTGYSWDSCYFYAKIFHHRRAIIYILNLQSANISIFMLFCWKCVSENIFSFVCWNYNFTNMISWKHFVYTIFFFYLKQIKCFFTHKLIKFCWFSQKQFLFGK